MTSEFSQVQSPNTATQGSNEPPDRFTHSWQRLHRPRQDAGHRRRFRIWTRKRTWELPIIWRTFVWNSTRKPLGPTDLINANVGLVGICSVKVTRLLCMVRCLVRNSHSTKPSIILQYLCRPTWFGRPTSDQS